MDVTNPGLVNVADQAIGNPSTTVQSLAIPEDSDILVPVADEGYPIARNFTDTGDGHGSRVPTPTESYVDGQRQPAVSQSRGQIPGVAPLFLPFPQDMVANTVIQQTVVQSGTPEYTVAGPRTSIQTNQGEDTKRPYVVSSVLDADTVGVPSATTLRYRLGVTVPDLQSFGISLLGRPLVFNEDTLTPGDAGATRRVSYFRADSITVDRQDPADHQVPILVEPHPGDSFYLFIQRQGSETFSELTGITTDVTISPAPAINIPNPPQGNLYQGTIDISTGPQPETPVPTGGIRVPTAINVNVSDQATSVGLPINVYI
jgi:hypothetical protein